MTKSERFREIMGRHATSMPAEALKWFQIGLQFGWDACKQRVAEVQVEAIDAEPREDE